MAADSLMWWRPASVQLDDDYVVWDASTAELYDTKALKRDVVFDLASVTNARDAVAFVANYGPLKVPPGQPPREAVSTELYWADTVRLLLRDLSYEQRGLAPPTNVVRTFEALSENPWADAPGPTLLEVIGVRYEALRLAEVTLTPCLTCGRFFTPANSRARYCRSACAATAASWREAQRDGRRTRRTDRMAAVG